MNTVKELLMQRKQYLESLKKTLSRKTASYPEGSLRVSTCKGHPQYYHRQNSQDRKGIYIPKRNSRLAERLAQKSYNQDLLSSINAELDAITLYLSHLPKAAAEEIYDLLSPARRALVVPMNEPDDAFAARWKSISYQEPDITASSSDLITENGERVRSKSEWIIANLLAKSGIPYRYEYSIYLNGLGTVYPDFTALNVRLRKEIIWEHLGMMDDPEYADRTVRKINAYNLNGYFFGDNLIFTAETLQHPINTHQVQTLIEHYLL